jgi:hypothetical protein
MSKLAKNSKEFQDLSSGWRSAQRRVGVRNFAKNAEILQKNRKKCRKVNHFGKENLKMREF